MASLRAHLVSFLLRRTMKRQLEAAQDAEDVRAIFNRGVPASTAGVRILADKLGGVPGEWVEPKRGAPVGHMLFLHGGGYVACSARTHRPYTTWFARAGFRVFAPDYRLAPEHPFPAGLEDALACYEELRVRPGPLVLAGDSAGGGLALSLLLSLKARDLPMPRAAALFSPVTDLMATGASIRENDGRCAMFRGDRMRLMAPAYVPNHTADDPVASPLYGDLAGLPPLLFHVGADEVLRDDSVRAAEKARDAGVKAELKVWPAVPHDWQLMHSFIPEGKQSLKEANRFLRRHAGIVP
ncbi:MAG TPA: alpha/beta hydrolase [Azospirillaceae bacterium]|nr:alpha/beta hydrolase [Azospirillaceae bacterium]